MASKETNPLSESHDFISAHPTLAELYPDVTRIMLFVAFEEADSESEPNYQQIIFTKDTEAVFRLDCSRDGCVGGGFDFAPFVEELMGCEESRSHGVLACKGSLGSGEDAECCSLKAEYRIIVD